MFKTYKKSILFHNPDYHCTFFYQTELRKLGWKAEIFVSDSYPASLLYSDDDILRAHNYTKNSKINYLIWFMSNFLRYKYIFYYGRPYTFSNIFKKLPVKMNYDPLLTLLKVCRKKIIYLPTGCRDEFTKASFSLFDNGNICGNCGIFDQCNDKSNARNLNLVSKYADLVIGTGFTEPSIDNLKHIKWKSFNLDIYNSNVVIPDEYLMPATENLRILHATNLKNRTSGKKNIKGSQHIFDAVDRLKREGYRCELIFIDNVRSKEMRYFQAQADLIIDQLIYGHWGSSALEGLALGKPVICYFNKVWKNNYVKNFSIESWPFIEANTESVYSVIKNLLNNPSLLVEYSKLSNDFANKHLDVVVNAKQFIDCLKSI
jgi:hypothetical protein